MGDPWKSISPEGVRAFSYGALSVTLLWLWAEDYLLIVNQIIMMIGLTPLMTTSIMASTVISLLLIMTFYGLHGKMPTTLMLQHMTWIENPDKFLIFFYVWINLIAAGLLNVLELNTFYQFVSLFAIFLLPSLVLGLKIQKKGGNI